MKIGVFKKALEEHQYKETCVCVEEHEDQRKSSSCSCIHIEISSVVHHNQEGHSEYGQGAPYISNEEEIEKATSC